METEELTFSKASKLLGKFSSNDKEMLKSEYENDIKEKPWLTLNDWLWGRLQKELIESNGDPSIYWMMSQFVSRFEGKSGLIYDRLALETKLKLDCTALNKEIVWTVSVIGDLKCFHGNEMDSKTFLLENNYNPANLASDKCEKQRCLCMYSIVPKRDEKGRVLFKNQS